VRDQEGARDRRNGENDHARSEEDPEKGLSERLIRCSGYSQPWLTSGFLTNPSIPCILQATFHASKGQTFSYFC